MSFCGRCGSKNQDDSRFCRQCGAPLDIDEPEAVEPVQETKAELESEQPKGAQPNTDLFPGLAKKESVSSTEPEQQPKQTEPVQEAKAEPSKEQTFFESLQKSMNSGSYSTTDSKGDTIIFSKVTKEDVQKSTTVAYVTLAIGLIIMVLVVFLYKFHVYLLTKDIPFSITEATIFDLLSDGVTGTFDTPNILLMVLIVGGVVISIGGFASEVCSGIGAIMYLVGGTLLLNMKYPINLYITELSPKISLIDPNNAAPSAILYSLLFFIPVLLLAISMVNLSFAKHHGLANNLKLH